MSICKSIVVLVVLLGAVALSPAQSEATKAESVSLAPKFKVGDEATYIATITSGRTDREGEEGAGRSVQDSRVELTVVRRVTGVTADAVTVELEYRRIKILNKSEFTAMEFDSDSPEAHDGEDLLAYLVRPLVGKSVRIRLTAMGRFLSIRLPEGIVPQGASKQTADDLMGDATIRDLFGPLFGLGRSSGLTAVGDSWDRRDEVQVTPFARLIVKRTDTLESVDRGMALIEVKGEVEMEVDPGQTEELPKLRSSSIDGAIVWDLERGMLRDYDISQRVQAARNDRDTIHLRTDESLTNIRLVE